MVKLSEGADMTIERIQYLLDTATEMLKEDIITGKIAEASVFKHRTNVISHYVNRHGMGYHIVVQGMPPSSIIIVDEQYQDLKLSLPAPVGVSVE